MAQPQAEVTQPPQEQAAQPQAEVTQPPQEQAALPQAEVTQPPQGQVAQPQAEVTQPPQGQAPPKQTVKPKQPEKAKCVVAVSLVFVFLAGLLIAIIWLPALPKRLEYSVERASVGGYNLTSNGSLSGNFAFVVQANNPSKAGFSFYYDRIGAAVAYEGRVLFSADSVFPPFYQPRRNATTLNLILAATDYKVVNESLARDFRMEMGGKGGLSLGLKIRAKMRLKLGALKVIHRTLKVYCGPLKVPFPNSSRVLCDADISQ